DVNVRCSAFLSPDNLRLVIVLINTNATAASAMNFSLGAFNAGPSSVYQTSGTNFFQSLGPLNPPLALPPLSLTTVVLDRSVFAGLTFTRTNLILTWPAAFNGFTLQVSTNLALGSWMTVSSPAPQIVGTNFQVALPVTHSLQFFRLVK
ncbi:MAG TPA: hypothetical protein VFB55_07315, partial [Verrucomicrobiae bacterium]|nr:hypothetical protein [Verrucomicrobiae bacterium]